jgi:hypothetical protein
MAGSITVSSITLDSDNNFSIRSNTGATILSANGTGLITGIASGSAITNAQLTTPTVSGNLSLDSTGTTGIRLSAANTLTFHTTGTEDMRITSAGNVGIGTNGPATKLEVSDGAVTAGAGGFVLYGRNSSSFPSTGGGYFCLTTNNVSADSGGMTVLTNNAGTLTERMSIDSAGLIKAGSSGTGEVYAQNTVKVWGAINVGSSSFYTSFGTSSISKVSTGVFTVNFSRTLASSRFGSGLSQYSAGYSFINNETTTSCRVNTTNTSNSAVDADVQFLIAGGS